MTEEEQAIWKALLGHFAYMAEGLNRIAFVDEQRLKLEYPPKREVRDADITHIPTEEERILEEQGGTGESTLTDWLTLDQPGPRESRYLHETAEVEAGVGRADSSDGSGETED